MDPRVQNAKGWMMLKIVGIGGGTGLPIVLGGFRNFETIRRPPNAHFDLTAVVCVSDNGGSTGRLRSTLKLPAMGDLRNCLISLSSSRSRLTQLFQYRFPGRDGIGGHALGNLIVTALCLSSGSLWQASCDAAEILGISGRVLPVTDVPVTLCAALKSGANVRGETSISASPDKIQRLWLDPAWPKPSPGVLEAIMKADVIIIGPGSLYTSLIPNLLVSGVAQAVKGSAALKIFVCNLMTQPGETSGFSVRDHVQAFENFMSGATVDVCVVNDGEIDSLLLKEYRRLGAEPVRCSPGRPEQIKPAIVRADLVAASPFRIRHDGLKLARLINSIVKRTPRRRIHAA